MNASKLSAAEEEPKRLRALSNIDAGLPPPNIPLEAPNNPGGGGGASEVVVFFGCS